MNIVKRLGMTLACASLIAIISPAMASAHEGHAHMLMGTLTMVAPDHVMVKVTDPKTKQDSVKTVAITAATKVLRGMPGTPAKKSDLTTGSRVIINIGEGKEPLSAKEIHLAAVPAAAH